MALTKETVVDKVEVIENGTVQVRTSTRIIEDGVQLSQSYHRHVIAPGQDYSSECDKVKAICAAAHTADIIAAYKAAEAAQGV